MKISLLPARTNCSIERSESGPSLDVFEIGRLDLIAEFLDQRLAGEFVLVGPAEVTDRTEIDKSNLQLLGGGSAEQAGSGGEHYGGRRNENFSHEFLLT